MGFLAGLRSACQRTIGAFGGDGRDTKVLQLIGDGNRLEEAGQLDAAMQCYLAAIKLAPRMALTHLSHGNILLAKGDAPAAIHAYTRALALQPGYPSAHYNLGNANAQLGNTQTALVCYQAALTLKPNFVDAEVALGNVQEDLQLFEESAESYGRALRLKPDYVNVYYNLSSVLQKLGRLDEAVQICRNALELDPACAQAHCNLGMALRIQGKLPEALHAFKQAMGLQKDFGAAASQAYRCTREMCDWSTLRADEAVLTDMVLRAVADIRPFGLLSMEPKGGQAAELHKKASLAFAQGQLQQRLPAVALVPRIAPEPGRLRIGYLSADFHEHATMHLLRGVLAAHDGAKFAICGYSYGLTIDTATHQARKHCEGFRDIAHLTDLEAAELIASDGVDILVDLKGYTQDFRIHISALRPAPVLLSWLGYPGTLGHPDLADYIVGDRIVTPRSHASHFSETLALMPHCYQPNDRQRPMGVRPNRAQAGLPATGFVFCSFNQSNKLNPDSLDVWCNLLHAVPVSVLWLMTTSQTAIDNLKRYVTARGVQAERLIFAPTLPLTEHLGRLQLADLVLDTYPYNSHTTGSDALWSGVPMVTRMGDTFASRVAASLLHAVELPELVTDNWRDYFALAKNLALDPQRLSELRNRLDKARFQTPLFDTNRFTLNLERLYRRIWDQHARGVKELIELSDEDVRN